MSRYSLAPHVFVCLAGEHFVLLDLKQDRYFAVEAARARGLAQLVAGWPAVPEEEAPSESAHQLLRTLLGQGIVVEDPPEAAQKSRLQVEPPVEEIVCEDYEKPPDLRCATVLAFLAAAMTTAFAVRRGSFERLVRRVEQRNSSVRAVAPDRERAQQLVQVFVYLRPFLFTARDRCLFETFALLEFLAWHDMYPHWVFGVQARPFAAHCWVQQNGAVLNDTVDRVSAFTQIMAV